MTTEKYLEIANKALDEKFANDIVILDIRKISVLTDYFIICDGNNANQIRAMAAEAEGKLGKAGLPLRRHEGDGSEGWLLLDFGDIIIHIFNNETRAYYKLEKVWADAVQVKI